MNNPEKILSQKLPHLKGIIKFFSLTVTAKKSNQKKLKSSNKLLKLRRLIKRFNVSYLVRLKKKARFQNKREISCKSSNKIIAKTAINMRKTS